MENSNIDKGNLEYIQALRALAAIMVVLHHAKAFLVGTKYEGLSFDLFWPGAFGVDLFFIISGFIIAYTSYNYDRKDILVFLKKRLIRIWPMYFIATMIYLVVFKSTDLSTMHGFSYTDKVEATSLLSVIKSLLFIPLNFNSPVYFGTATLFVGWTLNYEFYFYMVCAVGLIFSKNKLWFYLSWFLFTLFIIPSFMGITRQPRPIIEGAGYLNLTMQSLIWEFFSGACIAILFRNGKLNISGKKKSIAIIAIALAIPAYGYITKRNVDHGIQYFGLYYCIMFLLLTSCQSFIRDNIKIPRLILAIGDSSYSLYLLHPIIFILAFKFKEYAFPSVGYQNYYFMFLTVLISVLVSLLSYKYLERNIQNIFKR
ncbi:acyltransferase [Erwinia sp. Eh17-17]|uniref:acyltransferase family protein n=1 Tax=Erwinia sp. Eh17-17 TaxID=3080330 RepID=UPI003207DE35